MPRPTFMDRSFSVIGYRMPMAVALLCGLTLGLTLLSGLALQAGSPLGQMGILYPGLVLQGQVWRLVTWTFLELSPISLLFAVFLLGSVGADLCYRWGWRRFLKVYLGMAAVTGTLTCLLALAVPALQAHPYASAWAVLGALVAGWGILNPHAQIFFMLFLPARGRQIVWLTFALIALFAILESPVAVIPHFIAFALALIYFRDPGLMMFWYRLQMRKTGWSARRRPTHIRPVDDVDDRPRWYH